MSFSQRSHQSKKNNILYKPIISEKKNIITQQPSKDKFIKKNLFEENTNNINASFLTNLDSCIIKTVDNFELKKNIIIKDEKEKNLLNE